MHSADWVNVIYFTAFTAFGLFKPATGAARFKAALIGVLGLLLVLLRVATDPLRDWIPAIQMAAAYWQPGCFLAKPSTRLQAKFERADSMLFRALGLVRADPAKRGLTSSSAKSITNVLELMYLLCYPVVPLAVAALYLAGEQDRIDDFWYVVVLSAYPCYALLPFIQVLPPRSLKPGTNLNTPLRRFNLWLVRRVTHQANTFPSGHVAASISIALFLLQTIPIVGVVFLLIALGIALGCIAGGYHYAVDVIAAAAITTAVFVFLQVG